MKKKIEMAYSEKKIFLNNAKFNIFKKAIASKLPNLRFSTKTWLICYILATLTKVKVEKPFTRNKLRNPNLKEIRNLNII